MLKKQRLKNSKRNVFTDAPGQKNKKLMYRDIKPIFSLVSRI